MGKIDREQLRAAHEAEMKDTASDEALGFRFVSKEQVKKISTKYATLCAEYAACKGIYTSYRNAGLNEKADSFATGAAVAIENARAVAEILDILGIDHMNI